jgi:hypothetical protein
MNTFTPNTKIKSSEINANFAGLKNGTEIDNGAITQRSQVTGTTTISNSAAGYQDMTDMSITITTAGGDVFIAWHASCYSTASGSDNRFAILVDGVAVTGTAFTQHANSGFNFPCSMQYLKTGLSAASHTFKVQWYRASGTLVNAAASGVHLYRSFTVIEIKK